MCDVTNALLEDQTLSIIRGGACTLSHISDVNDWKGAPPVSMQFIGKDVPDLPLKEYMERLARYFKCSPSVFLAAMIYIDRFINRSNVTINRLTIHRLLIVSFVISAKFNEDLHYSNAYYAQVGGIDLAELNQLESLMVQVLSWDFSVDPSNFQQYFKELSVHPQMCHACNPSLPASKFCEHASKDTDKDEVVDKEMQDDDKYSDTITDNGKHMALQPENFFFGMSTPIA